MEIVELKTAYHWFCNKCSQENFALPQKAEIIDEEKQSIYREFMNLEIFEELPDNWQDFELVHIPDIVECVACKTSYYTSDERS